MSERESRYSDPDGQCVWVSAGLLTDHVCDRNFDCDHCPLHLALSPVAGRKESDRSAWPKDRLYSDRHFWLKQTSPTSARLGLTETAVSLLHPVLNWEIASKRTGEVRVIAHLACGRAVLAPPLSGRNVRPNPCLDIDALWPAADAWLSGYLLDLDFADWRETTANWIELAQAAPRYAQHREMIHLALQSAAPRHAELAATATADGGLPTTGLLPVVGRVAYAGLLAGILGCDLTAA
jgi:glycine cleavage system H lipoate-binding protein